MAIVTSELVNVPQQSVSYLINCTVAVGELSLFNSFAHRQEIDKLYTVIGEQGGELMT